MAKITWLGEDTETYAGPSFTVWNAITFPKDVAVDISDERMIGKARGNRFFKVTEGKEKHHEVETKIEGQDKVEAQTEIKPQETDHGKTETGTGYSPVKKKARSRKKPAAAGIPAADP
jgi:hypothetical protein